MNGRLRHLAVAASLVGLVAAGSMVVAAPPILSLTDPQTGKAAGVSAAPGVLHIVYFATHALAGIFCFSFLAASVYAVAMFVVDR